MKWLRLILGSAVLAAVVTGVFGLIGRTTSKQMIYTGRVTSVTDGRTVAGAQVSLDLPGMTPQVQHTDSLGLYRFIIQTREPKLAATLHVTAEGYKGQDRYIDIPIHDTADIRLTPLGSPPTVETQPPATQTFNIAFWTSKRKGGGTDSTVFVVLIGTKGTSPKFEFDGKQDRRFEKGSVDIFTVTTPYIGEVKQIHVGHNDAGENSPWALDQIEVLEQRSGARSVFQYSNWLSKTEGPRRIDQVLTAK